MDIKTENKRKFIINFVYAGIFIGIYYLTIKFALPYVFPFLFAAALAIFLQKPINRIKEKLHVKSHGPISILLVLLIVAVVVLLLVVFSIVVFNELKAFFSFLFSQFSSIGELFNIIEDFAMKIVVKLPAGIRTSAGDYIANFFNKVDTESANIDLSMLSAPLSGAWSVVKSLPSAILSSLVTVIACFFMTADYENIREMLLGLFSHERQLKIVSTKHTVSRAIGKLFKAYATIMLITFSEMFLGLYLMKVLGAYTGGYIAIIAFVTCIVDIIPVLGTGTVVIPWALYSLITGDIGLGIGLIILYAVITVLRQIIEPKLVANQVGLPAIVTIMAMFIGGKVFGTFGIIILPLTVIILKLMHDEGIFGKTEDAAPLSESGEEVTASVSADDNVDSTADMSEQTKENDGE